MGCTLGAHTGPCEPVDRGGPRSPWHPILRIPREAPCPLGLRLPRTPEIWPGFRGAQTECGACPIFSKNPLRFQGRVINFVLRFAPKGGDQTDSIVLAGRQPSPLRAGIEGPQLQELLTTNWVFMPVKTFRPLTPSLRFMTVADFSDITKTRPEKDLVVTRKKTGGRNMYGRITARGIGGGHKQKIRLVDFKRDKHGVEATVIAIEYDPCRSARLALLQYQDGEKRYIIAPNGLKVGSKVVSGPTAPPEVGNALPLKAIPVGLPIHNIELVPGKGAQLVRSAGSAATLMSRDGGYAQIRLPSGEIRLINENCYATIGQVGNLDHNNVVLGKAGRSRHLGIRPITRGVARNPVDHPNGGGAGKAKSGGGWHQLTSPWGLLAKGGRTRDRHKPSNRFILVRRNGLPMKKK